jgi:hypothetical protein
MNNLYSKSRFCGTIKNKFILHSLTLTSFAKAMEDPLHFYSPQQAAELIAEEDKSLHFT